MDYLAYLLLLTRSSCDLLFEFTRMNVGGIELTLGAVLNVIVIAVACYMVVTRKVNLFAIFVWAPFLLVTLISISWTPDRIAAIRLYISFLTYVSFFIIPYALRLVYRDSAWLLKAIIWSSIFPIVYGIFEYFFFLPSDNRVTSTFEHANVFAFYLVNIIGCILFVRSSSLIGFQRWSGSFAMPVVGVLLALLILTQTRAAWAGSIVILMTYAGWVDRRYLAGLLFIPFLLLIPSVQERIHDLSQGSEYTGQMQSDADTLNSYAWRELMWDSALKDAEDTPLLGKGLSSFRGNSVKFFPLPLAEGGTDAHSGFIQSIYENGYAGFFCFLFMNLSVLWRAWIGREVDRKGSFLVISIILANLCAMYSDNVYYYLSVNWYFWSFLGVVFAKWDQAVEQRRRAEATLHLADTVLHNPRFLTARADLRPNPGTSARDRVAQVTLGGDPQRDSEGNS